GVCREWIATVERVAEGNGTPDEISAGDAFRPVRDAFLERLTTITSPSIRGLLLLVAQIADVDCWAEGARPTCDPAHGAPLAHLVRDIFGNPFQEEPILRRSGLNRTIRAIAASIYEDQRF